MKKILFCVSILIMTGSIPVLADDQVRCETPFEKLEVLSLLATVKNDILGTLPQFCRPEEYKQLSDQIDPGESALSDFVNKLKTTKANEEDTTEIDADDDTKMDIVLFNTTKMIVLKKMWQQSSENMQEELLISRECGYLGLNRFPIHKNSKSKKSLNNEESALKKSKKVCRAVKFEEIAPFITKDVMAETLYNLKNIFPKSFPKLVESYCGSLSETDELLLKEDHYKDFATSERSIASVDDFSDWLKDLYADYKTKSDAPEGMASYDMVEELKKYHKEMQENFAEFYKVHVEMENKEGPFAWPPDHELYKAKNGAYYLKLTEAGKENKLQEQKKQLEESSKNFKKQIEGQQAGLMKFYQKSLAGKDDQPVPFYGLSGFSMVKDADGKIQIVADGELSSQSKENIKNYLIQVGNQQNLFEMKVDPHVTKIYSDILKSYGDGEDAQAAFAEAFSVKINKKNDGSIEFLQTMGTEYYKDLSSYHLENYIKENNIDLNKGPVPSPHVSGFLLTKKDDGSVALIPGFLIDPKYGTNQPTGYGLGMGYFGGLQGGGTVVEASDNNALALETSQFRIKSTMRNKYQNKTTDNEKFQTLDPGELSAIQYYTGSGYQQMNGCLRKSNCTAEEEKRINSLVSALDKIKSDQWKEQSKEDTQILFRGTSFIPKDIKDEIVKNPKGFILDKGFMSTSAEIGTAKGFAGNVDGSKITGDSYLFILKTKSCVGVASLSSVSPEDEFICPPGMKFNVKRKSAEENVYVLEEVEK